MSRLWYSLLRAAQLQQQRHDLDLQQPVPGSRARHRSWSTILIGAGVFMVLFSWILSSLYAARLWNFILVAGSAVFVAALVLMLIEAVLDLRR